MVFYEFRSPGPSRRATIELKNIQAADENGARAPKLKSNSL